MHVCMHFRDFCSVSCKLLLFITLFIISHRFICNCVCIPPPLLIVNLLLRFGSILNIYLFMHLLASFRLFLFFFPFCIIWFYSFPISLASSRSAYAVWFFRLPFSFPLSSSSFHFLYLVDLIQFNILFGDA